MSSNSTLHPSSHSWGNAIKDDVFKPGTIVALFAFLDNKFEVGINPACVAVRVEASGSVMVGPLTFSICCKHVASSSLKKCDVNPLSPFQLYIVSS